MYDFSSKTVLVSGSSQGIGLGIAKKFLELGANVIISSNDSKSLKAAQIELHKIGSSLLAIEASATNENDLERLVNNIKQKHGGIDFLINNVGAIGGIAPFEQISPQEWNEIFQLNVMSSVNLTRKVLAMMQSKLFGRIVFISSEKAIEPGVCMSHYAMTKAALLSLSKSLSNEMGKFGITVNSISPGVIPTPSWDQAAREAGLDRDEYAAQFCNNVIQSGKTGSVSDVASAVAFLCSEEARWITGSNIRVDGGSVRSI